MAANTREIEFERRQFRALILGNPNYFGTIQNSPYPVVKKISSNTSYEQLMCVGFHPQLQQLEAVIHIKNNGGYSGPLCSGGSQEYVRFYLSFDGGTSWDDQSVSQFTAYDLPGPKPLEYAVTRPASPPRKFCFFENVIKVRAILSWSSPPPPNTPNFVPVWGNVLDADVQVEAFKLFTLKHLFEAGQIKLPLQFQQTLDLEQEVSVIPPKELSLGETIETYMRARVPPHRFLFSTIEAQLSSDAPTVDVSGLQVDLPAELKKFKIDLSKVLEALQKTDGDTSFEELTCVGFDPANEALVGVINVKKASGYSGTLCQAGSIEYVAFWVDWGSGWEYAGTASVKVHDISGMPAAGLKYAVFEVVNTTKHRKPCNQGAVTPRVRAILSWQTPPPPANPDWVPVWGNREETTIHIAPGVLADYRPILESVSGVPVCSINQATGRTSGSYDQPFGGVLTISGFIPTAPDVATPISQLLRYRVQVRELPAGAWQTVGNDFTISVIEKIGPGLPAQFNILQQLQPDGYYIYREDMNVSGGGWRLVQGRVLAAWITAKPMTGLHEIRVEAKDPVTNAIYLAQTILCADGTTRTNVKVRLDEEPPVCAITITGFQHGGGPVQPAVECGTFQVGDIIHGSYSVFDEHFGLLTLEVEPVGPANGATVSPSFRSYPVPVPTGGEAGTWTLDTSPMKACGYIVRLRGRDRTVVSGDGSGWKCSESVGFCLKAANR